MCMSNLTNYIGNKTAFTQKPLKCLFKSLVFFSCAHVGVDRKNA